MTPDRESVSVGRKALWGFISSFRPARYITNKGSTLMSLDDFLLSVGNLPVYKHFPNVLELFRAFECAAPTRKTGGTRDLAWWKRDTRFHQVISDKGSVALWLHEVTEIHQFDGSRWFVSEDWAHAIINAMQKDGIKAAEAVVTKGAFLRETMSARITRANGTSFLVRCS